MNVQSDGHDHGVESRDLRQALDDRVVVFGAGDEPGRTALGAIVHRPQAFRTGQDGPVAERAVGRDVPSTDPDGDGRGRVAAQADAPEGRRSTFGQMDRRTRGSGGEGGAGGGKTGSGSGSSGYGPGGCEERIGG